MPAYHAADSSISDLRNADLKDKSASDLQPPITSSNNLYASDKSSEAVAGSSVGGKDPLQEAKAEISRLKQQLEQATRNKATQMKGVAQQQGVPVPIAAGVALLAFLLAYLLF